MDKILIKGVNIMKKESIPLFKVFMSEDAIQASSEVLRSGYIGQGIVVDQFEKAIQDFIGDAPTVVTTNSATSAEHLVFHMLKDKGKTANIHLGQMNWPGISEEDEILTTPLTCTATNWPILANKMRIKWVDVDPNTCNMDLDDLERKITRKTKAIMIVHWGGYPLDLDRIKQIQEKAFSLFGFRPIVIEDCAHAFGSTYKNKRIGSHGNISTFSFQAIKHLTSGDGGCIVFPEGYLDVANRAKLLRWFGIDRNQNRKDFRCETDISEYGFKMHMNDINASIGLANLSKINMVLDRHIENARYYNENLSNTSGVTLMENKNDRQSAYWLYTIKVDRRDDFMKMMAEKGIVVSRVHERNDIHSCVSQYKTILPNLDGLVGEMICIPVGWWINDEQREYIVDSIKGGW